MKRYLVFMYPEWEGYGGALDLVGDVDTKEEFLKVVQSSSEGECLNVLDTQTREIYKTKDIEIDLNHIVSSIFN